MLGLVAPPSFHYPLKLAYVGSTTYSADTTGAVQIAIDAGWQAGDLAIYHELWGSIDGAYTSSLVSGWTQLAANAGAPGSLPGGRLAAKVLASGDIGATRNGSHTTGTNTPRRNSVVLCFRPNRQIASFQALAAFNVEETNGNPAAQVADASTAEGPYIALGAYGVFTGVVDPRTFTPASDGDILNSSSRIGLKYRLRNPRDAGENYGIDMDDEGSNSLMSGVLLVR